MLLKRKTASNNILLLISG